MAKKSALPSRSREHFAEVLRPTLEHQLTAGWRPTRLNDRRQLAGKLADLVALNLAQTTVHFPYDTDILFEESMWTGSYLFMLSDKEDPSIEYKVRVTVPSDWNFVFRAADASQKHRALGGDRSKYCAPTSFFNQLVGLAPYFSDLEHLLGLDRVADKVREIKRIADHMGTNQKTGTSQRDQYGGLASYLDEVSGGKLHVHAKHTGTYTKWLPGQKHGPAMPSNLHLEVLGDYPHSFARLNQMCIGTVSIGWRDPNDKDREGGHSMACPGYLGIEIINPDNLIESRTHALLVNDSWDVVGESQRTLLAPLFRYNEVSWDGLDMTRNPEGQFYIKPSIVSEGGSRIRNAHVELVNTFTIGYRESHILPGTD